MSWGLILLLALALDATLGEPSWLWSRIRHPAVLMGQAVDFCDQRLNRGSNRIRNGRIVIAALTALALVIGLALHLLPDFGVIECLVLAVLLAQRSLVDHVGAVAEALRLGVAEGRRAVSMIVGRDTRDLDESAISRAAIESAAENFSDGVIAPAFWYLILGLPGVLAYKMINTADSMIGHRTVEYEEFGKAAAKLDDLVNWIPARLSALLLALVGGPKRAWRVIRDDAAMHRSPNAGWPEAAMAAGLDIALSGPRKYEGHITTDAWVNARARRMAGRADIVRAIRMLWIAWGVFALLVAALIVVI